MRRMKTYRPFDLVCAAALICSALPGMSVAQPAPAVAPVNLRFDFSGGPARAGYTRVAPTAVYSDDAGYGYDPGTQVAIGDNGNTTTSDKPFMFSAKVPEGNYVVTVTFGETMVHARRTSRLMMLAMAAAVIANGVMIHHFLSGYRLEKVAIYQALDDDDRGSLSLYKMVRR